MHNFRRLFIGLVLFTVSVEAQNDACACCSEQHNAFNFWLGEWEVYDNDGKIVGKNHILKEQGGCIISENWTSSNGQFSGSSTNFFNAQTQQWDQLWIDNAGSHLYLSGDRKGNQMILASKEIPRDNEPPYINRITWTLNKDGTVRQLWEILSEGEVINIAFDGLYRKK
jgi:hypothetical protein